MKVKATAKGFYIGSREPGDVFGMAESAMKKKDGKPVLPSWVSRVVEPKRAAANGEQGQDGELV